MTLPCPWPVGDANKQTSNSKEWVIEAWCVCGNDLNQICTKVPPGGVCPLPGTPWDIQGQVHVLLDTPWVGSKRS